MPDATIETPTSPPPVPPPTTNPPPNLFETPKVEPKALEAPASSNFMADLTKAFQKSVPEQPPEPVAKPPEAAQPPVAPAQPPAAAPKPEPAPEEPPAHLTQRAKEEWRKRDAVFKTELKSRDTRVRELEGELEKARKSVPELEAELAKTKQTLDERNQALERFDVENAPIFKEKVLEPEEGLRSRLTKQDLQPAEISALLSGNVSQREQVLENPRISAYRKGQIIQLLDKWDEVQETKAQMLANGKKSLAEYTRAQAEQESARKAQFLREAQAVYEDQSVQLMNKLEPFVDLASDQPNAKGWNEGVAFRKNLARAIYSGGLDRQELARAAIWAAAAPVYRELLGMALGRIQELNTQMEKMRGVTPTVRDSGGDTQVIQPARPAAGGDFMKTLVDRFNAEATP